MFRDAIAERVEEARRDHLGARRQFGRTREGRSAADTSGCSTSRKTSVGRSPWFFSSRTCQRPAIEGGYRPRCRGAAPPALMRRAAVTIHVPGTVEHFTQRVDALGRDHALAGMSFPRTRPNVADTASRSTLRLRVPGSGAGSGAGSRSAAGRRGRTSAPPPGAGATPGRRRRAVQRPIRRAVAHASMRRH